VTSRRSLAIGLALVALAVFAEWAALQRAPLQEPVGALDLRLAAADFAAGLLLAACGLVACTRRPGNRTGALLTAASAAWFLGTFAASGLSGYADFGSLFLTLHRGPLFHAVLAYPDGHLRSRAERAVVGACYATAAVASVGADSGVTIAIALLVLVAVARRFAQASARRRLALRAALGATAAVAAVLVTGAVLDLRGASEATDRGVLAAYELAAGGTALWFVLDLLRGRWTQSTVTGLVVDLGGATVGALRDRLAYALGDRTLVVGYRVPGPAQYVDDDGRPVVLPRRGSGRELTYVGGEQPVAVLVHDPGAIDDPALLEQVAAATRIAVSNVRLQSEIQARLGELKRSRRRIVEAGDAQRRRLERQLRDGAHARLEAVASILEHTPRRSASARFESMLAGTLAELANARDELSEFARGVHPSILSEGGLDAALADLAKRAAVPVELSPCGERFETAVEAAAYFACAEALTNIGKYAGASQAAITATRQGNRLEVFIADDGVGGADADAGSGLRGLRDRVEALGGTLSVESPVGAGTRIVAGLPLAPTTQSEMIA
jgi:signal transduction histidine kinase